MKMKKLAFAGFVALALSGCSSTVFKPLELRGDGVVEGRGGTRISQDGMDIWENGDPPRRFRLVGIIEDERHGGVIPMQMLNGDVVKKAREVGGHALIRISSDSQIVAYQSFGSATASTYGSTTRVSGTTFSAPVRRNAARFAVIQYVPSE